MMKARVLFCLLLLLGGLYSPDSAAAQEVQGVRATAGGVLLDFQDVDIRFVLAALAEAGNINVVYSDLPARRVTLRTNQPVPRENIPALLRSVAEAHGLVVVEEGAFLRIEAAGATPAGAARPGRPAEPGATPTEMRLFVYRLRHARADRLAATLQSVFGAGRGARPAAAGITRTPLSEALREQRIPPTVPDAPPPVTVEVRPAVTGLPGELQGEVQIVPDELTNSLLIRAHPGDWEIIQQAIQALDLRPLQVLIEGLIVEVRRTRDFEFGVSARGSDQTPAPPDRVVRGELRGRTSGELVLEVLRLGGLDLDVTLSALAATGQVRILSRPVILAQNNQEARILVGAQRPFIQVFRSLPTEAAVRDQVIQYRDVGTSLTIKPTINPDGYVNLQLLQEVSTATAETQFGAPVISTREASTYLFVRDGQTVVIGGLVERQRDQTRTGVPLLKDIPLLGMLFGGTRDAATQAELFLFLTPHIVATDEDVDRMREGVQEGSPLLRRQMPRQPTIIPPAPPPPQ